MRARDRVEAGARLGALVATRVPRGALVVGLPRGGVPVAAGVADALGAPLDVVLVRKLGTPGHRELAMGAIGEGGAVVWNEDLLGRLGVTDRQRQRVLDHERAELDRRSRVLRGDRPAPDVGGRTVVVVDDGVATGATARAAAQVLRTRGAGRVVLAAPVGPADFDGAPDFDETIIDQRPLGFTAVGEHYVDFREVSEAEVVALLERHR